MSSHVFVHPSLSLSGSRPSTGAVAVSAALLTGVLGSVLGPLAALVPSGLASVAWAAVRAPGVLLAAYLLIPYYKASLAPFVPIDLTVLLAVVNCLQIPILLFRPIRFRGSTLAIGLWLALAVLVLAGVLWAVDQQRALDRALVWWALILLPSVAAVRVGSDSRFVRQFLVTTLIAGTGIVALAVPETFGASRLAVIGQNTIQTAQISLIVALLVIVWLTRVASPAIGLLGAVVVPFAVVEAVASGSRGPLIAFAVVVALAVGLRIVSGARPSRQDALFVLLGAGGIAALLAVFERLPGQSVARLLGFGGSIVAGGTLDPSAQARIDMLNGALQMFGDRPLLGYGPAGFATFAEVRPELAAFIYPHDDLLQAAAELGVVGAALFLGLVGIALARPIPREAWSQAIRALFLFMFVDSFVSGDIYSDRLMWNLMVMLFAAPYVARVARGARILPPVRAQARRLANAP